MYLMPVEPLMPLDASVSMKKLDMKFQPNPVASTPVESFVRYGPRHRETSPLIDVCRELFDEAERLGHGAEDMAAIVRAIEARTAAG